MRRRTRSRRPKPTGETSRPSTQSSFAAKASPGARSASTSPCCAFPTRELSCGQGGRNEQRQDVHGPRQVRSGLPPCGDTRHQGRREETREERPERRSAGGVRAHVQGESEERPLAERVHRHSERKHLVQPV